MKKNLLGHTNGMFPVLVLLFFLFTFLAVSPLFAQTQVGASIPGDNSSDQFSRAVDMSADGTTLISGAFVNDDAGTNAGHAKVFEWNGSAWVQKGATIFGDAANANGGWDVAVNEDGSIIAFGMYRHPVNGNSSGKVRLYQWNGSSWVQMGADINGNAGNNLGRAISFNKTGNRVIIGAYNANTGAVTQSGYAKVFEWDGTSWNQMGADLNGDATGDGFGWAVSMDVDGDRIAIGGWRNDAGGVDAGHVKFFEWDGTSWNQMGATLQGAAPSTFFGSSVALTAAGDRAVIGASGSDVVATNAGQTTVYQWDGTTWSQLGTTINGLTSSSNEGFSVSISEDGTRFATGAYGYASSTGLARVFEYAGGDWELLGNTIQGMSSGEAFGYDVSLTTDGLQLATGAFGANSFTGEARVYSFDTSICTTTTTWNGSNWSNGLPNSTKEVLLSGYYDTNAEGSFSACSLELDINGTLSIATGDYVQMFNDFTSQGTVIMYQESSFVQVNDASASTNMGGITMVVDTPNLSSRDFMIMGSPLDAETRTAVWNSAFLVLEHDTNNFVPNPDVATAFPLAENFADDNYDNWTPYTGAINVAEGYIVRPQTGYGGPGGVFTYYYTQGNFNNGVISIPAIYNTPGTPTENKNASPNIVANPYPSAISATDFINGNALVDEVYFWEHNTPPSPSLPGAGSMNFSMEDISMYNLSGGVAAASGGSAPSDYISTAQGFGVKVNGAGTINFNNSMRRVDNNNTLRTSAIDDKLWLSVKANGFERGSQTLIAFSENTTQAWDAGYDSRRMATVVSLYSHLGEGQGELGIQSLNAFSAQQKVSLGFSSLITEDLEYTLQLDEAIGESLQGVSVYLFDSLTEELTELTTNSYTFRSNKGDYPNRFSLFFREPSLSTSENGLDTLQWFPNPSEGKITLWNPSGITLKKLSVFNMLGQEIKTIPLQKLGTQTIDLGALQQGMYFLHWHTEEGMQTDQLILK